MEVEENKRRHSLRETSTRNMANMLSVDYRNEFFFTSLREDIRVKKHLERFLFDKNDNGKKREACFSRVIYFCLPKSSEAN